MNKKNVFLILYTWTHMSCTKRRVRYVQHRLKHRTLHIQTSYKSSGNFPFLQAHGRTSEGNFFRNSCNSKTFVQLGWLVCRNVAASTKTKDTIIRCCCWRVPRSNEIAKSSGKHSVIATGRGRCHCQVVCFFTRSNSHRVHFASHSNS